MKNRVFSTLLIIAATTIVFDSCKKKSDDEEPSSGMSAKIDGASWSASAANCTATVENGVIDLSGFDLNGKSISLHANGVNAGNYPLGAGSSSTGTYSESPFNDFLSSASPHIGSFEITKLDAANKKMSGKFFFGAISQFNFDSVNVTSGTFTNITYTVPPVNAANALTCTIDGVNFVGSNFNVTNNVFAAMAIEMDVTTSSGTLPSVHLIIPNTEVAGTYNFSGTGNDLYYYPVGGGPAGKDISGQIVITTHNTSTKHIEGTFNCTAQDISGTGPVYTITNGVFSGNY